MTNKDPWSDIPEEKRDKIFQASVEEFAENGYLKASTNQIIKKAEISKGLLFHYFGNKENVYFATLDLVANRFIQKFTGLLQDDSDDIFEKIIVWNKHKFRLFSEYPLEYKILMGAFINTPEEIKKEVTERYQELSQLNISYFLSNIDYSKFRTEIDINKALEFIFLTMDAIGNKYIQQYKGKEEKIIYALSDITKDLEEYIVMMKHGLYRDL